MLATQQKKTIIWGWFSKTTQNKIADDLGMLDAINSGRTTLDVEGGFLQWGYPQIIHLKKGCSMK